MLVSFLIPFVLIGAFALMARQFVQKRTFEDDYRYDGGFGGTRYPKVLRYVWAETGMKCFAGADQSGLYLMAHPHRKPSRVWGSTGDSDIFQKNIRIPWSHLEYKPSRVFFGRRLWFELRGRKVYFTLPWDVGLKLLADAGRPMPWTAALSPSGPATPE